MGDSFFLKTKQDKMGWFLSDIFVYTYIYIYYIFCWLLLLLLLCFFLGQIFQFFQFVDNISTALELGFHVVNQNLEPPESLLKMVDLTDHQTVETPEIS